MANNHIFNKYVELKQNGTWRVIALCLLVSLGVVASGAGNAYLSPAIPSLKADPDAPFHVTDDQMSWVSSIGHLGAILGGIVVVPVTEHFGRKPTCIIFCLPYALGWLLNVAAINVSYLYASRFIVGFGQGMACGNCYVYIVEVALAKIRGMLNSFGSVGYCIGKLFNYGLGCVLDWDWLAVANLALVAFASCCYYFVPETPRWLLSKSNETRNAWRKEEAEVVLKRLRGGKQADISLELKEMEECALKNAKAVSWIAFFGRKNWFNLLICLTVFTVFQLGGSIIITQNTVTIFNASDTSMNSNLQTVVVGVCDVAGSILCVALVDVIGRRKLFIVSTFATTVFMTSLATYFYVSEVSDPDFAIQHLSWLPLLSIVLNELMLNMGLGSMIWLFPGELFSTEARGKASAVCVVWSRLCQFLATKYFVNLTDRVGLYGGFWICATFDLFGLVFFFFFIPETTNRSLEQLQDNIEDETNFEVP